MPSQKPVRHRRRCLHDYLYRSTHQANRACRWAATGWPDKIEMRHAFLNICIYYSYILGNYMNTSHRFAVGVHIMALLSMAEGPISSSFIAGSVDTNPAMIRR